MRGIARCSVAARTFRSPASHSRRPPPAHSFWPITARFLARSAIGAIGRTLPRRSHGGLLHTGNGFVNSPDNFAQAGLAQQDDIAFGQPVVDLHEQLGRIAECDLPLSEA